MFKHDDDIPIGKQTVFTVDTLTCQTQMWTSNITNGFISTLDYWISPSRIATSVTANIIDDSALYKCPL